MDTLEESLHTGPWLQIQGTLVDEKYLSNKQEDRQKP